MYLNSVLFVGFGLGLVVIGLVGTLVCGLFTFDSWVLGLWLTPGLVFGFPILGFRLAILVLSWWVPGFSFDCLEGNFIVGWFCSVCIMQNFRYFGYFAFGGCFVGVSLFSRIFFSGFSVSGFRVL